MLLCAFRSRVGIFGLSAGRHPAAHVLLVGHPVLLHADDAGPGQSGAVRFFFFSPDWVKKNGVEIPVEIRANPLAFIFFKLYKNNPCLRCSNFIVPQAT